MTALRSLVGGLVAGLMIGLWVITMFVILPTVIHTQRTVDKVCARTQGCHK